MALKISHTWTCDICGETRTFHQGGCEMFSSILELKSLPADWHYIRGRMVCPKHRIEIDRPQPFIVNEGE
jgi:hypothetical protein